LAVSPKTGQMACDNIPTPAEAALAASSATPVQQPAIVGRRTAGKAFEKAQVDLLDEQYGDGLLGTKEEREQARATGAGRRGGVGHADYLGPQDDGVSSLLFEMKNSNFDGMKPERVRANVLDHARQLHRYLGSPEVGEASSEFAMMFAVYNERPSDDKTLAIIETALAERGITPVWAEDFETTK
jgi:hypothetical protein